MKLTNISMEKIKDFLANEKQKLTFFIAILLIFIALGSNDEVKKLAQKQVAQIYSGQTESGSGSYDSSSSFSNDNTNTESGNDNAEDTNSGIENNEDQDQVNDNKNTSNGKINKLYCKGANSVIFTGVQYKNGDPEIKLEVDPAFEKKIQKERGLSLPLPLTPVYDLIFTVTPGINHYCLPEWDEEGNFLSHVIPPDSLPFKPYIEVDGEILVGPGALVQKGLNPDVGAEQEEWQYVWRIKGWPNGITDNTKLEKLIKAVQEGGHDIKMVVESTVNGRKTIHKKGMGFDLCAPIAGSGKYGVSFARGESSTLQVPALSEKVKNFWDNGLNKIEPYKSNVKNFSILSDLGKYNDGWVNDLFSKKSQEEAEKKYGLSGVLLQDKIIQVGLSSGACRGSKFLFTKNILDNKAGIAADSGAIIFDEADTTTLVHEFSHTFAGLNDEYVYKKNWVSLVGQENPDQLKASGIVLKNCSLNPIIDYTYNKTTYAQERQPGKPGFIGCSFFSPNPFHLDIPRENREYIYRPSEKSIMNSVGSNSNFNVVSCGHIMQAIKGGDAKSYFPECNKMEGIVDAGIAKAPIFQKLLATIGLNLNNQVATAYSDEELSSEPFEGIIVENFLPDGTIEGDFYSFSDTDNVTPTPSISFQNSILVPNQNVFVGTTTTIGGFTAIIQGGPFSVNNLNFKVNITGRGGSVNDLSNIELYTSSGVLVSNDANPMDNQIIFNDQFIISTSTSYVIKATLDPNFRSSQKIKLSTNFYKNDVVVRDLNTGRELPASKNNITLSEMTVVNPSASNGQSLWQKFWGLFLPSSW